MKICDFTASGQSLNWFLEKATMFAIILILYHKLSCWKRGTTRSSWLNCALRDDEAVYWVSVGHYEAVADGN